MSSKPGAIHGIGGGRLAVSRSRNCVLTRKLSPELSPTSLGLTLTRLKPLKRLERVKGIEPSLSAWEAGYMSRVESSNSAFRSGENNFFGQKPKYWDVFHDNRFRRRKRKKTFLSVVPVARVHKCVS